MPQPSDLPGHLALAPSLLIFLGGLLPVLLLILHAVRVWLRDRGLARAGEEALAAPPPPLSAGRTLRRGVIVADAAPLRVEIDQVGEAEDDPARVIWRETDRRLVRAPFLLQVSQERVAVEPHLGTLIAAPLLESPHGETLRRTLVGELAPWQEVLVLGELEQREPPGQGAYRDPPRRWVLRPSLVSSTFVEDHRSEARQARRWIARALVGWSLIAGLGLWPILDLHLNSELEYVRVDEKKLEGDVRRVLVAVEGAFYWLEVDPDTHARAVVGGRLAIVRFGTRLFRWPQVHLHAGIGALVLGLALWGVYRLEVRSHRLWWRASHLRQIERR